MNLGAIVARFVFPPDGFNDEDFQRVIEHIEYIAESWGLNVELAQVDGGASA